MQLCIFMGMDSLCATHSQQKNRSISFSFEYCVTIQNEKWEERKNVYEYRPHVKMEINAPADFVLTFSTTISFFYSNRCRVSHESREGWGERGRDINTHTHSLTQGCAMNFYLYEFCNEYFVHAVWVPQVSIVCLWIACSGACLRWCRECAHCVKMPETSSSHRCHCRRLHSISSPMFDHFNNYE